MSACMGFWAQSPGQENPQPRLIIAGPRPEIPGQPRLPVNTAKTRMRPLYD
jgi:hypothetical protein